MRTRPVPGWDGQAWTGVLHLDIEHHANLLPWQRLAALTSLRAHGPAWAYAAPEAGCVPDPDPRALPDWLAGSAVGPAAPCAA